MKRFWVTRLIGLAGICLMGQTAQGGWVEELRKMPLGTNAMTLKLTSVPVLLRAFHPGPEVKALIVMPSSTDALYFFDRGMVKFESPSPSLFDAVAALTNKTAVRAVFRNNFLLLATEKDLLTPIMEGDAEVYRALGKKRIQTRLEWFDKDWDVVEGVVEQLAGGKVRPGKGTQDSWHFNRFNLVGNDLTVEEFCRAVCLAGRISMKAGDRELVFSVDPRSSAQ